MEEVVHDVIDFRSLVEKEEMVDVSSRLQIRHG
jgi:hypothetical protein